MSNPNNTNDEIAPFGGAGQNDVSDVPIYLTIASSIESKRWEERVATWSLLKELLGGASRSGRRKTARRTYPASSDGTRRKKNAVEALYLLVLDADRGDDLLEIVARIRALGYAAAVHSSYSHLSTETRIKFDDYKRHTGAGEVTAERGAST